MAKIFRHANDRRGTQLLHVALQEYLTVADRVLIEAAAINTVFVSQSKHKLITRLPEW